MKHNLPAALLIALTATLMHAAQPPATTAAEKTKSTAKAPAPAKSPAKSPAKPSAKQPPDRLDGPPFLSCRAYAIADGKSGKILWGMNEATPGKGASTTKIMCAVVVLELAKNDPKILDETITFSKYADSITGSTAGVNAGESLTVRECLYALMLPSGNDAGTAIAEHFNARLDPADPLRDKPTVTSRSNYIAQMNRTAVRLGMKETTYRSVFGDGLGAEEMTISPRDLLKLAHHAMQDPLFRQIVATPSYDCDLKTPDGSTRRTTWTNTNKLLEIDGYDGVKTGTTTSAGACLVSSGRRGEDHLLIAVLGASGDLARFADTRNLFRWAWLQRGHK